MKKIWNWLMPTVCALSLAACGGGGGPNAAPPAASAASGSTGGTAAAYSVSVDVQRAGASITQVTSTETVQSVATVVTAAGTPVEGVVVKFSELVGALLTFAPVSATALTDASGKATVDVKATDSARIGATTVSASATIGSTAATSVTKAIQLNAGALTPGTPVVPSAINFVGSAPSNTAIVIKGTGGNGRSESAILTFRVVDSSNAPVNAATVDFTLNTNNGGASIVQLSAVSSSDGLVTVTVTSGTLPASIVVMAKARTGSATSQSDTLLVSNSVPVAGSFEIVAAKYNLDGRKTGDSTSISAYAADANGNPVPDGVAISFQTDFGAVGSSTLGGCLTVNGVCSVAFRVQDPRGAGVATVIGTVRVGGTTTLSRSISINMAGSTASSYIAQTADTQQPVTKLTFVGSCKQSFELRLSDGAGRSTAAGTTIGASFVSTGVAVAVNTGSPVLDQLDGQFKPTLFGFEIDLTATALVPACKPGGVVADGAAYFRFAFTSPGGVVYAQRIALAYPQ